MEEKTAMEQRIEALAGRVEALIADYSVATLQATTKWAQAKIVMHHMSNALRRARAFVPEATLRAEIDAALKAEERWNAE